MKTSHISILLAILLTLGVGLSAALLIIGPDRVEQQTVDLFQTQQSLIAEQGAMRISETFRDTQARLDEAADWLGRYGPTPGEAGKLQQSLYELSHPTDRELGLALLMSSKNGQITATGAGIDDERARALTDRRLAFESGDHTGPVKLCAHCLKRAGSVSLVAPLDDGRKLVANIRLDKMLSDIFERITRGRQAQATLLDGKGNVLFAERAPEAGDDADMIAGAADLPHVDWRVVVETPRASIAPEVRESVQTMLYAAIAILFVLGLALGVLGYLKYREQSERLERMRALARTDKLATVGMLGSSVAHEIRNIISAVELNLELARRNDADEGEQFLDRAADSIERLTNLAENITGYVGGDESRTERFALRDAVDEAVELVTPKIDDRLLEVRVTDNPTVRGSKGGITQVIVNLLLNAVDSIGEAPKAGIAIRVRETDEAGIIAVSDDGPGIDEEILDEIFEPFTSTKHGEGVEGGTGLGLWLCSEIIDQHGGTIEAANRDGGGARFTVRLPRADTVPTSSEEPDEPTDNAPGREIPG